MPLNNKAQSLFKYFKLDEYCLSGLKNRTLSFRAVNNFNDPLDCFYIPTFKGNYTFWKELLGNYIRALYYLVFTGNLNSYSNVQLNYVQLFQNQGDLIEHELKLEYFHDLLKQPFKEPIVVKTLNFLAENYPPNGTQSLDLYSLEYVLLRLNNFFIDVIFDYFKQKGLLVNQRSRQRPGDRYMQELNKGGWLKEIKPDQRVQHYVDIQTNLEQLKTSNIIIDGMPAEDRGKYCRENIFFMYFDFPRAFCEELKRLMLPQPFVTCFSKTEGNSAMWSHYADDHKGICLKFSVDLASKLRECNSDVENRNSPVSRSEVTYSEKDFLELDFSSNLYNLDPITRKACWKSVSALTDQHLISEQLEKICCSKSKDWQYEQEIRLFTYRMYNDPELNREWLQYKYEFRNLKAVYFGMRISTSQIQSIIRLLCRNRTKTHLKFYRMSLNLDHRNIMISCKLDPTFFIKGHTVIE